MRLTSVSYNCCPHNDQQYRGQIQFHYNWKHTKTGHTGKSSQWFDNRRQFLEHLSKWNWMGDGVWIYTE